MADWGHRPPSVYCIIIIIIIIFKTLIIIIIIFFTLGINDPEGFEKKVRLLENGSGHYSVQSVPKES